MGTATNRSPRTIYQRDWRTLYVWGGIVAFVALGGMLLDIVLTMLPGWGTDTVPPTATAWFAQLESNPLLALRNLDLLNVALSLLALPMYVALHGALRRTAPGLSTLGLVVVVVGTALFAAANSALPMLELSRQFGRATDESARVALAAAADALLSRGAHGSFGAYPGFLLSEIGTLIMALAMLRNGVFGARTAWTGAFGATVLLAYTTLYTFVGSGSLVLAIAVPGGLLMIAWYAVVGRRLVALGRDGTRSRFVESLSPTLSPLPVGLHRDSD